MRRSMLASIAGVMLLAGLAEARDVRLRSPAALHATAVTMAGRPAVRLRWRDTARGETRWEVRRGRRHVVLRANRTRYTDRRVERGRRYRYRVRPCRRHRCARWTSAVVATPAPTTPAAPAPGSPDGGAGTSPASGPGGGASGGSSPDPFAGSPRIGGCPVFPKDNPWNTDIAAFKVDKNSGAYIGSLSGLTLWPDFGSGQYGDFGIPFGTVPSDQPLVPIRFKDPSVAGESDPGPYPIPPGARVEGGTDHHVLIVRQGDCWLFELYDATKQPDNGWSVYSAARFDLRSNALRHDGYTSADAAGLPMFPGLARVDEVAAGAIDRALRIAIPRTQKAYIHPATHAASSSTDPALPPMGLRLRLKASYDVGALTGQARVIARALQVYGAFVADNSGGSRVFISGTPDPGWNDDDLNQLKRIPADQLEAVETGPVIPG
jgi:hypothetical protein